MPKQVIRWYFALLLAVVVGLGATLWSVVRAPSVDAPASAAVPFPDPCTLNAVECL